MKSIILPTIILTAAASAQTVPVQGVNVTERFSIGVSYANATNTGDYFGFSDVDTSGTSVDLRAFLGSNVYLMASYMDMNTDLHTTVLPPTVANDYFDLSSYSFGIGTKLAAGNGYFDLSYAYSRIHFPYDSIRTNQNIIKVGYTVEFGNGFNLGIAVMEVFNEDLQIFGTNIDIDNVTAPTVTLGYGSGPGFNISVSYSTENTVFGAPDGDGTTTASVRYSF